MKDLPNTLKSELQKCFEDIRKETKLELIDEIEKWIDNNVGLGGDIDCGSFSEWLDELSLK